MKSVLVNLIMMGFKLITRACYLTKHSIEKLPDHQIKFRYTILYRHNIWIKKDF